MLDDVSLMSWVTKTCLMIFNVSSPHPVTEKVIYQPRFLLWFSLLVLLVPNTNTDRTELQVHSLVEESALFKLVLYSVDRDIDNLKMKDSKKRLNRKFNKKINYNQTGTQRAQTSAKALDADPLQNVMGSVKGR